MSKLSNLRILDFGFYFPKLLANGITFGGRGISLYLAIFFHRRHSFSEGGGQG